jgi:predicted transcriptional regulator
MLIAVFVFLAAMAESSDVSLHDLAAAMACAGRDDHRLRALSPDAPMQSAEAALLRTTQAEFPVLDTHRQLVGVLTKAAIVANAQDRDTKRRVSDAMKTEIETVPLSAPLEDVLDLLQQAETAFVAVTDRGGHFVGYITRENIGEWMVLNQGRRST